MEIIWRPEAWQQLSDIIDYRAEAAGKRSAARIAEKIMDAASKLISHPEMGPTESYLEGLPFKYRSVVADKQYKIVYRIDKEIIHIFSVWDCRQEPEALKEEVTRKK